MKTTVRILLVCMGNICRSPTAEGVLRRLVEERGLAERIVVDSAGTHDYHTGQPPDPRAVAAAAKRGYDLSGIRSRRVVPADFTKFDYLLAMDRENVADLAAMRPAAGTAQIRLLLEFGIRNTEIEVPDPFYAGAQGFEHVLDLVEDAAGDLLNHLVKTKLQQTAKR